MKQLSPVQTVAPATALIDAAAARAQARVSHTDDDTLLDGYVEAARTLIDGPNGILQTCLISQTWRDAWDRFGPCLRLTAEPAIAVTSVEYWAPDGVAFETLDASNYWLVNDRLGSAVVPRKGITWPDTETRPDAVRVTYTAGFGPDAADVPENIKLAMRLLVSHWYENREAVIVGQVEARDLPMGVRTLLGPWLRVPV